MTRKEPYEAVQGSGQNGMQSGSGACTSPDADLHDCRCKERTLRILYRMQNMEKLLSWATRVVVSPTARQGKRRSIEKAEKAKAGGSAPDLPTSARCRMARKQVEPPQTGKSK